jgi:membrane glycosyltransferase
MVLRRLIVILIAAGAPFGLGLLLWRLLAPGGLTIAKLLMLVGYAGTSPWVGLCLANGVIGWLLLLMVRVPSPPAATAVVPTAIAITVRNEAIGAVLAPAAALLRDLDSIGVGASFGLFVLSDTNDTDLIAIEERAIAAFPGRVHYRRRATNAGFKAGNVMDFMDHLADGFELALILDADSRMSARAVLRLVQAMQDDPSLGIAQHLAVGLPASSAFPRLFQFGMRAGMRTWATAIAWWQGNACVYWGHNAMLRIAPFRDHCRLPLLPGGRSILSHDQVEAAMLRAAGWGVRLLPQEDGSAEANPPALPEFQRRELRWLAGNFEYRHLLALPGLRLMGRWQLAQAILMFASAPFYLVFLLGAALAAATDVTSAFPAGAALSLTVGWAGALYSPKLLGYLQVLLQHHARARYGGSVRLAAGVVLETLFTLQLDAISVVSKTLATIRLALGHPTRWTAQNRVDRGVSWSEAARLLWPHTLLGCVVFAAFAEAGWRCALWALPFTGGLLTAIPFCVLTADPRVGFWLQRHRLAAIPEELETA